MSDKEILKQAIQKAIDGGWKHKTPDDATRIVDEDPFEDIIECWDLDWRDTPDAYYHIIFDHDFARALWGDAPKIWDETDNYLDNDDSSDKGFIWNWQHHLQQLVVAEDPFKYLGEYMND